MPPNLGLVREELGSKVSRAGEFLCYSHFTISLACRYRATRDASLVQGVQGRDVQNKCANLPRA
jgi:hypothetical protein